MRFRLNPRYNFFRRDYWFGEVDGRPLSAFRIAFALIVLKDALYHIPLAYDFYSDNGIVPRAALLELARPDRFSIMDAMPHAWMAILVFLVWAVVAVGLLVGYRTRLMTVLNLLLILSIHERDVYILTGADTIMRCLSFWSVFIKLGTYYSVDARRLLRAGYEPKRTVFAFPVRMIQLQVALVYIFTGWLKAVGPMWRDGEALGYVLQLDTMLLPPGQFFRSIAPDWLLSLATRATMAAEVGFAALVFSPVLQPSLRVAGLAAMAAIHLGIGLMLSIPDFSIIMISSYLLFFEPEWIEAIARSVRRALRWTDTPPAEPLLPEPRTSRVSQPVTRAATVVVLAVLMVGAIWWGVDYMGEYTDPIAPMPDSLRPALWYTGLWQYWDLFAPMPLQIDGWLTVPGRFEDGTTLELRTGGPLNGDMLRTSFGPLVRWEKFEENVNNNRYDPILLAWGRYYCREYNDVQARPEGSRLATLEIHFHYRRAHAPGQAPNAYTDDLLWTHWCYDEYAY